MGTTSTVNGYPTPSGGDANNIPADLLALRAVMDLGSADKRLTSTQIAALTDPQKPAGLLVYDTTDGLLKISNGSTFTELPGTAPIGAGMDYFGTDIPAGWLLRDGSAVSRTTYAALFAKIGVTFGAGNGTTTFNLPDDRGRVTAGLDNMGGSDAGRLSAANAMGTAVGAETHTLSSSEMPTHHHVATATAYNVPAGAGATVHAVNGNAGVSLTSDTGGGGAHNNMQPTLLVNKIIRAF